VTGNLERWRGDELLPANELADAQKLLQDSLSPNTRRAYEQSWRAFGEWCAERRVSPLPAAPETLVAYITYMNKAGKKPATISRALAAISVTHGLKGHESPRKSQLVQRAWRGVCRTRGLAPTRKAPVTDKLLDQVVGTIPTNTLLGLRNRALILFGFAAALRRSELVAVKVEHLTLEEKGCRLWIPRSKTDQSGHGAEVYVPRWDDALCPVKALEEWLEYARIRSGPVFRAVGRWEHVGEEPLDDRMVALVVQKAVKDAGFDPRAFGGHSLRAGLATSAAEKGTPADAIMKHTRHKSHAMVFQYIRRALGYDTSPAKLR